MSPSRHARRRLKPRVDKLLEAARWTAVDVGNASTTDLVLLLAEGAKPVIARRANLLDRGGDA